MSAHRQFSKRSMLDCKAAAAHGAAAMIFTSILTLLPALFGLAGLGLSGQPTEVRRVVVEDQLIIRVPVRVRRLAPAFEWVEHKGPKCIPAVDIRGALLSGPSQVDFVLAGRKRVRASFDDTCPALDFYGGFYLNTADERVCARRDMIRSRLGSGCVIEKFHRLKPQPRD